VGSDPAVGARRAFFGFGRASLAKVALRTELGGSSSFFAIVSPGAELWFSGARLAIEVFWAGLHKFCSRWYRERKDEMGDVGPEVYIYIYIYMYV
jgi:hypothetical protein